MHCAISFSKHLGGGLGGQERLQVMGLKRVQHHRQAVGRRDGNHLIDPGEVGRIGRRDVIGRGEGEDSVISAQVGPPADIGRNQDLAPQRVELIGAAALQVGRRIGDAQIGKQRMR